MIPIDLAPADRKMSELGVAADLAEHYGAVLIYTAATSTAPSQMGHNPEKFAAILCEFFQVQATAHDLKTSSRAVASHADISVMVVRDE